MPSEVVETNHLSGDSLTLFGTLPTETEVTTEIKAPEDKHNIALITCSVLGIAALFPWNVLITANNYWSYTFGDDTNFEFYLSAVVNWPSWITLIIFTKVGPMFSFNSRIISTLIIYCAMLIFIPGICSTTLSLNLKGLLVLIASFLIGLASSVLMGTVFGLAALFPGKHMTAAMSGMGIGGVIVGVLAIITQATLGGLENGAVIQAWVYFMSAVLVMVIAMVLYIIMTKTEYTKFYIERYYTETKLQQLRDSEKGRPIGWYWAIFRKIWVNALTVFFVFFVSLSFFPGLMLAVVPTYASVTWYNLIIPLEFNIFDMCGRSLPYIFTIPDRFVWMFALARVIFCPLIIFCVNPVLFPSPELWIYGINALFAFSNGFFGTLPMVYAPGKVTTDEQQTTGIMMSFFVNFGIFCGTNFAIVLSVLVLE